MQDDDKAVHLKAANILIACGTPSAPRRCRAQSFRYRLLALILVAGQRAFIVCQVREKSEASDAIGGDSVTINDHRAVEELAEIVPVEVPAILEFLHQRAGSKVSRACQSFSTTRRRMSA